MIYLASITVVNVLIALGFSTIAVVDPQMILPAGMAVTPAATTYALYGLARSLGVAGFVLAAVVRQEARLLFWLAALAGAIQFLDAAVGIYQSDMAKIVGPLGVGVAQFWAIWRYRDDLT